MHFLVFFQIFALFLCRAGVCLNDSNACISKGKDGSFTIVQCCPDFDWNGEKCAECPAGSYGDRCKENCLPGYYGVQCRKRCSCGDHAQCDPVKGCICKEKWTGLNWAEKCFNGSFVEQHNLTKQKKDQDDVNPSVTSDLKDTAMVLYLLILGAIMCVVWIVIAVIKIKKKKRQLKINKSTNLKTVAFESDRIVDVEGLYWEI